MRYYFYTIEAEKKSGIRINTSGVVKSSNPIEAYEAIVKENNKRYGELSYIIKDIKNIK